MNEDPESAALRAQYEQFPYPPRNPAEEAKRLQLTGLDQLPVLNHTCFGGRESFAGARLLVAGCGTGDAVVYLAEQLRDSDARIVAIDLSGKSLDIARRRVESRGLPNVEWHRMSLLDLPASGLGPFRYINCSGVLHHLQDPDAGLAALVSVLDDHGALGIMVYGRYGRTGIYQLQELLRRIADGETNPQRRIAQARQVLASLPASNWFRRGEELARDHLAGGDAGLFDLLLHSHDQPFTVPGLHAWLERQGLELLRYSVFENLRYDPAQYLKEPALRQSIGSLDRREREAIAELLAGDMTRHAFYAARRSPETPSITDDDQVPFLWGGPHTHAECLGRLRATPDKPLEFVSRYLTIQFQPAALTLPVFELMDGTRSVGQIVAGVLEREPHGEEAEVRKELKAVYRSLHGVDLAFLRHHSVPVFGPDIAELAT
jgi:2-polyprenyl-3-methyl-5-hydroxy-6-metoxy-1,4-benzoquinol methylase